jgi:hypothetical protein
MNDEVETVAIDETPKPAVSHDRLKEMVTVFRDAVDTNAKDARRDRDYYDGRQISEAVRNDLERRGQPAIWTNKIGSAVTGVLGILDAGQSDPEAMPRNYSGQDAADVVTKTLRYVADRADHKKTRKLTSSNFVIQGVCAALTVFEGNKITSNRIRFDDFVFDPYSEELDFSDAKYLGIAKMMEADDVEALYGEAYARLGSPTGQDSDFLGFMADDKKKNWWADVKRKRIRVVDLYYEARGDWHRAVFIRDGMLYAGVSPYHNDEGETICPITATSWEVTQDGCRYGMVRNMIPLQDEVNSRRSKLLHHANSRQTQQTDQFAPPANKEIARREAAKPDGTIPFGWAPIAAPDMAQGQMLVLQQSTADLDRMAPTPAVLGRVASNNESGRARQILQQAGYTELARAFSNFEAFELSIYRKMWWIAKEYLGPMLVRITDDPRAVEFLSINEPQMGVVEQPAIHPETGAPMINPMTGAPATIAVPGQVGVKNHLAKMDMDIILTTVPDTVTLAQETFQALSEYASAMRVSFLDPSVWAAIEMSPMPDKRETIDRLKALKQEGDQMGAEAAQAQAQAAQQALGVELAAKQAKAAKDTASAQKTTIEAEKLKQDRDITDAVVALHVQQAAQPMVDASIWNQQYGQQPFPGY